MDPDSCDDVCFCCFNKAKDFVKLINCKHRSFFDHVVVKDIKLLNFSICSSCHVFLLKIESFKQQIIINLEIMTDPFELSKRLVNTSHDQKAGQYLGQRISLAIQRGNAASLLGTIPFTRDVGLQVITHRIPKRLKQSETVTSSFSPDVTLPIITSVKSCSVTVKDKKVAKKLQPTASQSSQNSSSNSQLLRVLSGNGNSSQGSGSPNLFTKPGQLLLISANGQNPANNKANAITNPGLFTINTSPGNPIFTNTGQLLRVHGNDQNHVNNTANAITNPVQFTYPIQIKNEQCTTQSKVAVNLVLSQLNKALQVSSNSGHGQSQSNADNKKPIYILTNTGQLLPAVVQPSSNQTRLSNRKRDPTDKNLIFKISDSDSDIEIDERNDCDDMASLTKDVKVKKERNNSQDSMAPVELEQGSPDSELPTTRVIQNRYFGKIRAATLTEEGIEEERAKLRESEQYKMLPFKCENCVISYKFEYKLADHVERRHKPKPGAPTCGICKLVLKNSDVLEAHTRTHVKRYDCTVCEKRFDKLKFAITHYNEAHSAEYDDDRRCPNCSYSTRSHSEFLKHKDSHYQYICTECPQKFDTKGGRQAHLRSVHKKGKFVCKECQKVYCTAYGLQIHTLAYHVRDDTESSYCVPCGKQFSNKYYLRNHLRTHVAHVKENCKRFECHDCGRRFLQKWELKRHIMYHHLNVVRHKCQHCGKACFTRNLLNRHISSVHEKKRPPKDKICQYCGRGFPTNAQLTTHVRTHTGERPLQCDLCPATFAQNAARYNHRRLVHKVTKRAAK